MLSAEEKQEMLNDAHCAKRKESFRIARNNTPVSSYDAYLKFLSKVQKVFDQATESIIKSPKARFKL